MRRGRWRRRRCKRPGCARCCFPPHARRLYIAGYSPPCALRAVNLSASPPVTRTISGTNSPCISVDGTGTSIQLNVPSGLRFVPNGNAGTLWVAESTGGIIRRLNLTAPGVLGNSSSILPNGAPLTSGWVRNIIIDPDNNIYLPQYSVRGRT